MEVFIGSEPIPPIVNVNQSAPNQPDEIFITLSNTENMRPAESLLEGRELSIKTFILAFMYNNKLIYFIQLHQSMTIVSHFLACLEEFMTTLTNVLVN